MQFSARISQKRLKFIGDQTRARFDSLVEKLDGQFVVLTLEKRPSPKTLDQMGYYRSTVLPDFAEESGEDDLKLLHMDLKESFLGKHRRTNHITGEEVYYVPSLADVSVKEMSDFLDRVIRYAAQNGWEIRPPRTGGG